MKDGVREKVVELKTIKIKEAPNKWMNRKSQALNEKGNEAYPFVGFWIGHLLGPNGTVGVDDDRRVGEGDLRWRQISGHG